MFFTIPGSILTDLINLPIRNSVKIILLNSKNQLLLMCADDPKVTAIDGTYHGRFWFMIGGEIEPNESLQAAAIREIFEETGISQSEITLGPVVWFGSVDLMIKGILTTIKQTFIVAHTRQETTSLANLTLSEQAVFKTPLVLSRGD